MALVKVLGAAEGTAGVEEVSSPEASKRGRFGSGSTAGEALEDMA